MKISLDIKDEKAAFVMELLHSLPFFKAKPLTDNKAEFLNDLRDAVEEVKLIKSGQMKGRPAKELLDEL